VRTSRSDILSNRALRQSDDSRNNKMSPQLKTSPCVPGSMDRMQFFASSRRERTDPTGSDSNRDTPNFSECQSSVYQISAMRARILARVVQTSCNLPLLSSRQDKSQHFNNAVIAAFKTTVTSAVGRADSRCGGSWKGKTSGSISGR
jgi:hypothetical protein